METTAMTSGGAASPDAELLEALTDRGWRFRDLDLVRSLIRDHKTAEALEAELLNMDLRSFGGHALPDPIAMKKLNQLQGPKILQLVSARDICQSSIDASLKGAQRHNRLLRFLLTDGCTEVVAVEYVPIPSITEDVAPGTKVCLESKIPAHNGILCLNPKSVRVVGGVVQSLYEEWQISQKYSGFSRVPLRTSQSEDGASAPPFEKLQIEIHHHSVDRQLPRSQGIQVNKGLNTVHNMANKTVNDLKTGSLTTLAEDKPSSSNPRPKEVSEAVPVQNQAASQKLLQKMSQPTYDGRNSRGRQQRFKDKGDNTAVFTLDEWEKRKGTDLRPSITSEIQDVSHDEELARQLQSQLDLEDHHATSGNSEAEHIRRSMFSFGGSEERKYEGRGDFRGRGRGRGRGRRRY